MTKYSCGHEHSYIFLRKDILDYIIYEEWQKTKGLNGTRELCIHCFYKSLSKKQLQRLKDKKGMLKND